VHELEPALSWKVPAAHVAQAVAAAAEYLPARQLVHVVVVELTW